MENGKEASILEKSRGKAEAILENADDLQDLAKRTQEKVKSIKVGDETVRSLLELVSTFIRMITAHIKGEYREIPFRSLLLIVAGMLYFLNPFDLIPDFIPLSGLLDDLTLLLLILKSVKKDVLEFRQWESR